MFAVLRFNCQTLGSVVTADVHEEVDWILSSFSAGLRRNDIFRGFIYIYCQVVVGSSQYKYSKRCLV